MRVGSLVPVDQHHVRGVNRRLALGDAALDVLLWVRAGVALDEVHALDHHAALVGQHASTRPRLPLSRPASTITVSFFRIAVSPLAMMST